MKEILYKLRRKLHQNAELSGKEINTSNIIKLELEALHPDQLVYNLGGYGIMAMFSGKEPGKTILLRADMDALPIQEKDLEYNSFYPEVSHKCGHDGHSTIILGLAHTLIKRTFPGKVLLLFQPAEETGQGAEAILREEIFKDLEIDFCVGIHNLPGFSERAIVSRSGIFASASCGMKLKLCGSSSHASQPEIGNSPILAFTAILESSSRSS